MMPWVPQNDILGHRSTKAFLSHMGANGLYEVLLNQTVVIAGHNAMPQRMVSSHLESCVSLLGMPVFYQC